MSAMRARVIQMINNFYRDGEDNCIVPDLGSNTALGEYCCMGHFDALHIELVEWGEEWNGQSMHDMINTTITSKYNGCYNIKNVVCISDDDSKDAQFWREAETMPYLFISLVRMKPIEDKPSYILRTLLEQFNKLEHVIAYYTYDHSEIVVIRIGKSYIKEFREILAMYDKMSIFKMYSVFAVKESELENCGNIEDEIIDCRLSATIKNQSRVGEYERQLRKFFEFGKMPEKFQIEYYQTLGNSDCLIEISQVPMTRMLKCYIMGNLLTHTNEYYNRAFFNVETQFLLMEKREHGTVDRR